MKHHEKMFKDHADNMKIGAKELLEFADKNEKEIIKDY